MNAVIDDVRRLPDAGPTSFKAKVRLPHLSLPQAHSGLTSHRWNLRKDCS